MRRVSGIPLNGRVFVVLAALLAACGGDRGGGDPIIPPPVVTPPVPGPLVPSGPFVAGQSYFGRDGYIEYVAGNSPVVLTAPHGGSLQPTDLANRSCGINGLDLNTQELVREIRADFFRITGKYPHIVINRLARGKLDANRDSTEATCGDPRAGVAWSEWHALIGIARKAAIESGGGKAWYMDMHAHNHPIVRLELGYNTPLNLPDSELDAVPQYEQNSTMRTMSAAATHVSYSELLRGPGSLGALYAANGIRSIPSDSAADRAPGSGPYWNAGYNTLRYGCRSGGPMCGVQAEIQFDLLATPDRRARFSEVTVIALRTFLEENWELRL